MVERFLKINPVKASMHSGFGWDGPLLHLHEEVPGTGVLHVMQPVVRWDRVGRDRFTRHISVTVELIDSAGRQEFDLERSDTLNKADAKQARRESKPPLRGDNPFFWSRWGWPAIAILGGVAVVALLFNLRS